MAHFICHAGTDEVRDNGIGGRITSKTAARIDLLEERAARREDQLHQQLEEVKAMLARIESSNTHQK